MKNDIQFEVIEQPTPDILNFFEQKLLEFNVARWEVKAKIPLAIKVAHHDGKILAGAAAKTFGDWLLIDNIWVDESLRRQNLGTKIVEKLEQAAIARGCKFALLDTLNFQARPFYEKFGYTVQWTQENYPKDGCKYFMVKKLV